MVVYAGALRPLGLRARLVGWIQRLVLGPPGAPPRPRLPGVPGLSAAFWEAPTPGGKAFGWEARRTLAAEVAVEVSAAHSEQDRVAVGAEEADPGRGGRPQ